MVNVHQYLPKYSMIVLQKSLEQIIKTIPLSGNTMHLFSYAMNLYFLSLFVLSETKVWLQSYHFLSKKGKKGETVFAF